MRKRTTPKSETPSVQGRGFQAKSIKSYAIYFIAVCKRIATDDLTLYLACVTAAIGAAVVVLWGTL